MWGARRGGPRTLLGTNIANLYCALGEDPLVLGSVHPPEWDSSLEVFSGERVFCFKQQQTVFRQKRHRGLKVLDILVIQLGKFLKLFKAPFFWCPLNPDVQNMCLQTQIQYPIHILPCIHHKAYYKEGKSPQRTTIHNFLKCCSSVLSKCEISCKIFPCPFLFA